MKNSWTGGQYSMFRALFGLYLFVHFVELVPWGAEIFSSRGALADGSASPLLYAFPNLLALYDAPWFVQALLVVGAGLSVMLVLGWHDRIAATGLWYLWACLFGRNPLIANPSLPYVGWMLLAHACIPISPYGAWGARGRLDPAGGWKMPGLIFAVAWVLMALGYSYSGYIKLGSPSWVDGTALARVLENPLARPGLARDLMLAMPPVLLKAATWGALGLELAFAPLALIRRLRPWLWTAMVALHLHLFLVLNFVDLTMGMVFLHLFTFDPGWIPPRRAPASEVLFYDGHCGLCHRTVRFVLAEGAAGMIEFSPLQGELFRNSVPETERSRLPDSLVLRDSGGVLLTRSTAVLHLLHRMGGVWRVLAWVAGVIPASVRDAAYDVVARIRYKLFARPTEACPIMPKELRARFHP